MEPADARAHRAGGAHAETAREIALADKPLPLARIVIIEDVRRSGPASRRLTRCAPSPGDARICLVPYPVRARPALRDDIEEVHSAPLRQNI
jgi:hypothetical protein